MSLVQIRCPKCGKAFGAVVPEDKKVENSVLCRFCSNERGNWPPNHRMVSGEEKTVITK